jgi:hypothetical protein
MDKVIEMLKEKEDGFTATKNKKLV